MKITIIASDGGALSVQKKIDLDFVPRTIAYDGAYELFYVTNAVDAASSQGSVAAGTQVLEVDASSGEDKGRVLFDLEDDKGIFKDFVVSSLHYASNTGTLFALCGSCPAIAEVGIV